MLSDPANCIIFLASKDFEPEGVLAKKEYWYRFPYEDVKFSEDLKRIIAEQKCPENGLKLDLPPVNTLIPKNFDILPESLQLS